MHKLIYAHGTDFHKTHYSSAIFYQALLNFIVIIIRRQLELDRPLIFVWPSITDTNNINNQLDATITVY